MCESVMCPAVHGVSDGLERVHLCSYLQVQTGEVDQQVSPTLSHPHIHHTIT